MSIPRPARIMISLFALLAMAWVHAVRPARGFECDCGGVSQFTMQDHCHGSHSAACHDDEEESVPCHEQHDADEDTHRHAALIDSLLALKADSSLFASVAVVMPVAFQISPLLTTVSNGGVKVQRKVVPVDGRRWPQVLANVIALRV